jgi:steroid 5-alpha reductase family enzyme
MLSGGTNFVIINLVTWGISAMPHPYYRQQAATWLVILWGLRLSAFLFYRILKIGDDNRFDGLRDRPCQFLGFWIFQMIWVWVVSLPVTYVNSDDNSNVPRSLFWQVLLQ